MQSKKFYFIWKFLFCLTKTKEAKFFLTPFSNKIIYNRYFSKPYNKKEKELSPKEEKEQEIAIIGRTTWTYLRFLRRLKRRYLMKRKRKKKAKTIWRYNKFYLNKPMSKFWVSIDKKPKPPFRNYFNLLPWHNKLGSEKILRFHNALFVKYKKEIWHANKSIYLSNPVLLKQFKKIKTSKFFKVTKETKFKLNFFKKLPSYRKK